MRPTLLVFAKAPRLGSGKTRLARDIGAVHALRINRWLQARTMRAAFDPRWRAVLCVTPAGAQDRLWPRSPRRDQGAGDLGVRLARAFRAIRGPVGVIGTDAPHVSRGRIWAGFRALAHARFALGPAMDGGFWLLTARKGREAAPAFSGVRWSSEHAAADVIARLPGRCVQVATLRDVDTLADLRALRLSPGAVPSGHALDDGL